MAERSLIVFIYLPGEVEAVPAGVFYHDGDAGVGRFVYGRKYVERPNAMPVDPVALPLGMEPREVVTNEGFYGAFVDAAPDYWGRLVIAAEKHEWFQRMVFNILVRNTDDHPKNHGFLCHGNEMELTPAYDLVPTLTTAGVGTDFRLAMSVGESGRDASIDNALSQAEQFGLSRKMAGDMVASMKAVCRKWAQVYRDSGLSAREIEILSPAMRNCDL
jgi:hypothetical protein